MLVILLDVVADIGGRMAGVEVSAESWKGALNAFLRALVINLPSFVFIGVLGDFSDLFARTGEGEVFTKRNLRTLRNAGNGLVVAAIASAVIVPSILSWIDGEGRGVLLHFNDLALGVGAMGLAMLGLCHVFAEGVRLKTENDEIV